MAKSVLWVRVICATLEETDPGAVRVVARVGSVSKSTSKQSSPYPHWDEKLNFCVCNMNEHLVLELHKVQLLFRQKLLGLATIPLHTIRHSDRETSGQWSFLFLQSASGDLVPTQHQLQLDTHFALPNDLPEDLKESLDRKLSKLDEVLEREVEIIEIQQQRLVTGDLSPPRREAVSYSYPPSPTSDSSSPANMRGLSATPPIITVTSPTSAALHSNSDGLPRSSDEPDYSMTVKRSPVKGSGRASKHTKSPFSEQERSIIKRESLRTRNRWKEVLNNPDFQEKMLRLRNKDGEKARNGGGIFTLAQVVDQLKQQRRESQIQANIKSFALNADFLTRSHSMIKSKRKIVKNTNLMDEDMRIHVYKRAVEALVYPASDPDSHQFEKWTAHKPTNCSECNSLLWGISKQGVKCSRCGKICHERCATSASQECIRIHDQHSSFVDLYLAAISEKMHRTVTNRQTIFETLREAFSVSEADNSRITEEIKRKILDLAQYFSAEVKVKVIAAQGLNITKDKAVYVSVTVGHNKKRTKTVKGDGIPYWNEEFKFECYNYHEPIQIRVWSERGTALARVAQRLTNEGDIFLGEKIIEVRRVGAPRDVWYKLDKRIMDSQVSGSINVNLSACVENDPVIAPFHDQYMKLHEQMFVHMHLTQGNYLLSISPEPVKEEDGDSYKLNFLPVIAQEIIDEFALRYAVEPIYRMMVHHQLLVKYRHSLTGALQVMENLLRNLRYQMFTLVAADNAVRAVGATRLLEEYFDSSNFGRDNFARLLDVLMSSLRIDLQQYREYYPANDQGKLQELVDTCQLIGAVLEFQQQAMGILTAGKLSDMIIDSMKECLKSTFDLIVSNCVPPNFDGQGHPALVVTDTPFQFFNQLMEQVKSAVHDDRTVYSPLISRFCAESFGDTSAFEMWGMFSSTIEHVFDDPASLDIFPPNAYIYLLNAVTRFYKFLLENTPGYATMVPKFHQWFIPCVRHWLQEYQKGALSFVDNAWEDDKNNDKFASYQKQPFSNSVYQMFFFLNKGYELLHSLHTPDGVPMDEETKHVNFHDFSQVICSIVGHYVDKVSVNLPELVGNLNQACMLLNNLHALRVHTQGLFEEMGGERNIGQAALEALNDFQANVLAKELLSWCVFASRSLTGEVLQAVSILQSELMRLRGQGGVDKNEMKLIAAPLMDMLTKRARTFAESCETVVLQKVIKEVWYVVLESLHRMLLPMLQWDKEGVQAVACEFPAHYYTSRQCTALENMLDLLIREFFERGGQVTVKPATLDRGIKQLKGIIYLYRQTTEMLISDYIADANTTAQSTDASCGELSMEIDAFRHPATGELEGTIRVLSATNLKPFQGGIRNLRPYVELNLVVPQATPPSHKRKFVTNHKSSSSSPKFNQSFKFILDTWEEKCELQVTAKHHSSTFGLGSDKVIGVAVISLSSVLKDANVTLGLSHSLPCSDQGQVLLNVLSVRTNDEHAKEFVALKRQKRDVKDHDANN